MEILWFNVLFTVKIMHKVSFKWILFNIALKQIFTLVMLCTKQQYTFLIFPKWLLKYLFKQKHFQEKICITIQTPIQSHTKPESFVLLPSTHMFPGHHTEYKQYHNSSYHDSHWTTYQQSMLYHPCTGKWGDGHRTLYWLLLVFN